MDDPVPNDARIRGRAGVATLWRNNLSHLVQKHPDGSDRIAVITIECSPKPLCIINAYLPSQGSTDFRLQYSNHLDQLHEICQKFTSKDYIIILGGDLNASLTSPKYPHDHQAKAALEEMRIHLPSPHPTTPTFYSHNGRDSRQIDFFASSHPNIIQAHEPIQLASNTSSHLPIPASLEVTLHIPDAASEGSTPSNHARIKWDKVDVYLYKEQVCSNFSKLAKLDNPEAVHEEITSILTSAAEKAAPPPRKRPCRKSSIPISTYVKSKLKACRQLHKSTPPSARNQNPTIRAAKRALRRAIRIEQARHRQDLYSKLMQAHSDKDNLFYKLVAKQRGKGRHSIHSLRVDGRTITDRPGLLRAWANHFEALGTPSDNPNFDSTHKDRITRTRECISDFISLSKPYESANPVSPDEVQKAINRLNTNKAADSRGLTAEHLKLAIPHILHPLSRLFTICMQEGIQPAAFSTGSLTPVGKKDKDLLDPNNSRGIVVSPVISKAYEHVVNSREDVTDETDDLQFGFTKDKSPTMAALLATEAQAENKDQGLPTYMASLDTQKAFDVVWQDSLAVRLLLSKPLDTWKAHTLLLEDTKLQVRIGPDLSHPFSITQGVGQGKILSTKNYKDYIDPSLKLYRTSRAGCYIGIYYVGAPTCADDVLFLTSSPEHLQYLLSIAHEFARQERYIIHPGKTRIIICNYKGPDPTVLHQWSMGEKILEPSPTLTHLGINRYACPTASMNVVEDRTKTARRTGFSLLGAGFHGKAGLGNPCLKKMMDTYIMPRLLYGLEALIVTDKHKATLEAFTRDLLKKLQSLPPRTANEASYILFNTLPTEALLDIKTLTFFGKVIADKDSILHQVSVRQLATKSLHSNSWFIAILKLCDKYRLTSPHHLLLFPPKQSAWKKFVKTAVTHHWREELRRGAEQKSTLALIQDPAEPPTWDHVDNNTHAVAKKRLQTRLLTNTYTLQMHRSTFYKEDPTCRICRTGPETVIHLLSICPALSHLRAMLMAPIINHITNFSIPTIRNDSILSPEEELARLLMGIHHYDIKASRLISTACFKLVHQRHLLFTRVT